MDQYQEVIVAHSESVLKIRMKRPLADDYVISGCQQNLVISETMHPRYKITMERYHEIIVALSESVVKKRMELPLAEN